MQLSKRRFHEFLHYTARVSQARTPRSKTSWEQVERAPHPLRCRPPGVRDDWPRISMDYIGTILENGEAFYAPLKIPPTRFSTHEVAYGPDGYHHAAVSTD